MGKSKKRKYCANVGAQMLYKKKYRNKNTKPKSTREFVVCCNNKTMVLYEIRFFLTTFII